VDEERFNEPPRTLYKLEYVDEGSIYVDWLWATELELDQVAASYISPSIRRATFDEAELYEEAYADGYGIAAMLEFESRDDGITFRIEVGEDGKLKNGKKMFECAVCAKHKDFDAEVGVVGDFYISELREDVLWHICYECVMLTIEVEEVETELTEEGETDS
jgi:hypothetical protein